MIKRPVVDGTTCVTAGTSENGWKSWCQLDSYGCIGVSFTVTLDEGEENEVNARLFGANDPEWADEILIVDQEINEIGDRAVLFDDVAALQFYRIKIKSTDENKPASLTTRGVAKPVSIT